jgi:hypothetical protein
MTIKKKKSDDNWEHELTLDRVQGFVSDVKDKGQFITVTGWTLDHRHWREGNRILLTLPDEHRSSRYKILSLRRPGDPNDMYFMDLQFLMRKSHGRKLGDTH